MDDSQAAKVIRFPGKHKESTPVASPAPVEPTRTQARRPSLRGGVSLLAIALATVAVNRYAFGGGATARSTGGSRAVASMTPTFERDAAWEKSLAERLAHAEDVRGPAALGRAVTPAEEFRFGTLENRYRIEWRAESDRRHIDRVRLNEGDAVEVDAPKLFAKYGPLFTDGFASARRAGGSGPDERPGKEIFELVNGRGEVVSRPTVEFDANHRLISIENRPAQI